MKLGQRWKGWRIRKSIRRWAKEIGPWGAIEQSAMASEHQDPKVPLYYTFYRPLGEIITKENMKLKVPSQGRKKYCSIILRSIRVGLVQNENVFEAGE